MHELSLAQEIIRIAEQYTPAGNTDRVLSIKVKIGKLQNVLLESLEFCFEALIQNTKMETAKLLIEHIPIRCACGACGEVSELNGFLYACSFCENTEITIISGNELSVFEIEFEDSAADEKVIS